MKKLILPAFMLIANVFAGEAQTICGGDKSLSYCINHYDRQCDAKNYAACMFVGMLYGNQEQYSEAKKYYETICNKANGKDSFAVELIDGNMTKKLPMIEVMKPACGELGKFYYNGWGVRQSYEKAFQYSKKACDLGSGEWCGTGVGLAYFYGKGVKKDLKTALKFFTKSCDLEYGGGCDMVGAFYHDGLVVKQNFSKAKELFGKACDLGYQVGCDNYKKLKEKGY